MQKPKMPKKYNHGEIEPQIYKFWEDLNAFSPEGTSEVRKKHNYEVKKETFCVLMPPPNANAPLHCGHATYAIQDLVTRYKRMQGFQSLYVPGTDHAGFETQVVYEKKLKKEGKSRFDFDAQTLYQNILDFVKENSDLSIKQLKRLGMSADWSRNTFMLEDKVLDLVLDTFKKMNKDGLIYRDVYLVNYSPYHGTTFSNLETTHIEKVSPLYYVKYLLKDSKTESVTIATTRPETIYADVAIAVNPKDSRYKDMVGKMVINPLNDKEIPIIEDTYVDVEFGTGALKITPGHDFNDYEIGIKHDLEMISVINLDGKMNKHAKDVVGMTANKARVKTAEILEEKGLLEKVDEKYVNNVLVDYKDEKYIEPMLLPNWFIKMEELAKRTIEVVKEDKVSFNQETWKREMLRWLENIKDWPISRQIVFGIKIPAWYNVEDTPDLHVVFLDKEGNHQDGVISDLLKDYSLEEIEGGLQKLIAPLNAKYEISQEKPGDRYIQETDTFDTWFSSGQWPLTTLGYPEGEDFKKFFPTSFMDSMWDILFFWIARMIMFSLYLTDEIPYKDVFIHGRLNDAQGKKMSKSKGNVIDPIKYVEEYGADSLRMGVLVGGNMAAKNTSLSEDKVRGYRNFANKIWNMGRFMNIMFDKFEGEVDLNAFEKTDKHSEKDKEILKDSEALVGEITSRLDNYDFKEAGDSIYHFIWHKVADEYIEYVKESENKEITLGVLRHVFMTSLKLLHPYMPFVTEKIWEYIPENNEGPLIVAQWPTV
ncbi:valine--tRNA ligase [Patescibacteria group bacterium]